MPRDRSGGGERDRRLDVAEAWIWLTQARLLGRRVAHAPAEAVSVDM